MSLNNIEQLIIDNINTCIANTKIFLKGNNNKIRNIHKAIRGILTLNNIKEYYYIKPNNLNNNLINLNFNINKYLNDYFNNFYAWLIFPENETLIIPITKLNLVTPENIWFDNNNISILI